MTNAPGATASKTMPTVLVQDSDPAAAPVAVARINSDQTDHDHF